MKVRMPEWTLVYQIGNNCTQEVFYLEQQVFREDPHCVLYQATESADFPGQFYVLVEFQGSVGGSAIQILQRRGGQGVPAVQATPIVQIYSGNRLEMQIDLGRIQDGESIPINSQVCIDENGKIGTRGTPIGILVSPVDSNSRTARVLINPGEPMDLAFRSNVFGALDAVAKGDFSPFQPRPTFKTRYQRVMDALKGG